MTMYHAPVGRFQVGVFERWLRSLQGTRPKRYASLAVDTLAVVQAHIGQNLQRG